MSRQSDISALLGRAEEQLQVIEREYDSSLHAQVIAAPLRIEIKSFCENLRSVLDYLAHDVRERYCPSADVKKRFYFPVFSKASDFSVCVNKWFPGLQVEAPVIWEELQKWQPYNPGNDWLQHFNMINNENKHGSLVEQTRQEIESRVEAKIVSGGRVSWNPKSVQFGSGVYIGGVPIDPVTQMPVTDPRLSVVKTVWFDFFFDGVEESALELLRKSIKGIKAITNALTPLL